MFGDFFNIYIKSPNMTLKEKLVKYEYSKTWYTKISFNDILEISRYTINFPRVPLKTKRYCIMHDISQYPTLNGYPLKLRDGIYGFYNSVIDNDLKMDTVFDLKSLKSRIEKLNTLKKNFSHSLLNIISSKELIFIYNKFKHLNPISINELIWLFYYDLNQRPICKICKKELKVDKFRFYDRFCSPNCQHSKEGESLISATREKNNIQKYGIPYPHLATGHKTISKWQRKICNKLKSLFKDLKFCLEDEIFIDISNYANFNNKQKYIQPDLIYNNKIIEFFGDFWHANPALYAADNIVEWEITAQEIWERDKLRINILQDMGYQVLIIWESEFNRDPNIILEKCKQFLY